MKLRVALFSMMCLVVFATVIPATAQDAPPSRPLCAADEVTMIADIATAFGDQLNTVMNKAYDQTLDGDTARLLDWLTLYQSFLLNEFPGVPDCIDGVVYGNNVGITLNQQMILQAAVLLTHIQQAAKNSDSDLSKPLSDLVQVQSETVEAGMSAISAVVSQMQAGVASPE